MRNENRIEFCHWINLLLHPVFIPRLESRWLRYNVLTDLQILRVVYRDVGSIQKVGGPCTQGHPHKQKLATFKLQRGICLIIREKWGGARAPFVPSSYVNGGLFNISEHEMKNLAIRFANADYRMEALFIPESSFTMVINNSCINSQIFVFFSTT